MAIIDAKLYDPAVAVTRFTSSAIAMTALDTTNLRASFVVPDNGKVLVRLAGTLHGAATFPQILFGVMDGSNVVARVAPYLGGGNLASTSRLRAEATFVVPGLPQTSTVTWDAAFGVEVPVAATGIKYGGPNTSTANNAFGGFQFEIWRT